MDLEKEQELFYQIALSQTANIGDRLARVLLGHFGSAKDIFLAKAKELEQIAQFGNLRINSLKKAIDQHKIEQEINFIQKHKIQALFLNDKNYPKRLKECNDAPILLYYRGNANLNATKVVSIIGTRLNTDYGLRCTETLLDGLKMHEDVLVVSGLALGIDGIAHKKSMMHGIPTVGVIAHGLDRMYPAQHRNLAKEMVENGGLLTEFPMNTIADKQNFPIRNRIVAGMSDVTVVVETDEKGGSMITAKLATSYNRDVAAFPGRTIDQKSRGCNYLIKTNIAQMITNADDLASLMNWETNENKIVIQKKLFSSLSKEELSITEILGNSEGIHVDELQLKTAIPNSKLAALLLSLELEGIVKTLPGKRYRLN